MHANSSSQNCQTRRDFVALTGGCVLATGAAVALGLASACSMRDQRPEFRYTLLDGSQHHSAALHGRVTLVNFWATTCAICVAEMPQWVELYRELKPAGSFDMLAVAMSYDPPARVSHFAESRSLPFGVVIDNTGAVAKAFGDVRVTPSLFLLDIQGRIARSYVGRIDVAKVRRDIAALATRA